ncbi:hypothetical protein HNP55_002399 [Paucibacter oligotrophus]|uniref:Ig-like domain-containing protein n=1 Tax=Roseateles oligotrophus TaxID=1769250 RepID=A0A840L762_9BURK|nr:hypothetical protein [Roseateles oligotrophus]MBB4843876.1 hypothetical protein [Roseateles oligotrophus]
MKTWIYCWQHLLLPMLLALVMSGCGGGGEAPPLAAPQINAQPADLEVLPGSPARFEVTVAPTEGLRYQWERSTDSGATWVAINSAESNSLSLASTDSADNSSLFRVRVSNDAGQSLSSAAKLTVKPQLVSPSIASQPQAMRALQGQAASFAITATGTGLSYRWQSSRNGSDWSDVEGGTGPILALNSLSLAQDQLQLRVIVSNAAGAVTSDAAWLTVLAPSAQAQFIQQPASTAVVAPAPASMTVKVSGNPMPSLQWQRSSDGGANYSNIDGATEASFTTSATTLADHGTRYRVIASNTEGISTSEPATLTVTAALSAPSWTLQPQDLNATAGQQITLRAAAEGNPIPSLQWQVSTDNGLSFANINGATQSSYSLNAGANDDGRRFRVTATNSLGNSNSRTALLRVSSPTSALSGRAWTAGKALDTSNLMLTGVGSATAMDAQGRVTVLYSKMVQDRMALHALRLEPGSKGGAAIYGTPVVLDAGTPGDFATKLRLAVSPAGNAFASWTHKATCKDANEKPPCFAVSTSRFLVSRGNWEAGQIANNISDIDAPMINDAGDVAARIAIVDPAQALGMGLAIGWRAADQSSFSSKSWPIDINGSFIPMAVTLDAAGRIAVFGTQTQPLSTNTDIAAFRGNVRSGLGAVEIIDQRGAKASFNKVWSNPKGQIVLMWSQDNGSRPSVYLASLDSAEGSWTVHDSGQTPPATDAVIPASLSDDGEFNWYFYGRCQVLRRTTAVWAEPAALPAQMCGSTGIPGSPALAPNGHLLTLHPTDGSWLSYDAQLRQVISARPSVSTGPGYLLGFQKPMTVLPGTLLLSNAGVGAYVSINTFDSPPSQSAPNGDSRGVFSAWAWYLQ